jgi:predicted RNA-binding Zn-ribbon protein involved in translation (DUF1610 family)
MAEAYCVKCKKKKELKDPKEVVFEGKKGKRKALQSKCPDCGTTITRIIGKS